MESILRLYPIAISIYIFYIPDSIHDSRDANILRR